MQGRRGALLRRLRRVDALLARWEAVEANRALPVARRRRLRVPPLTPEALQEVRGLVLEELARLTWAAQPSRLRTRMPHR